MHNGDTMRNATVECFFQSYGLFFYGCPYDLVSGWWNERPNHDDHILYLKYEDILRDPRRVVNQVAALDLHGGELTKDTVSSIVHELSFDNMKRNPKANRSDTSYIDFSIYPFIRKGKVGDWKNFVTEKRKEEVEKRYKDCFLSIGLDFEIDEDLS